MDIWFALLFYCVFSLFALIGLPIVSRLTSNSQLALCTSRIAGVVVYAYFVWLGSSLKIVDYQSRWLIRGLFCVFLAAGAIAISKLPSLPRLKDFLWIEGTSFALYLLYLFARSHHPSAEGTEHFMDMALLSAAGKTHSFPFVDPWYAGKLVNYYYYGSYTVSLLSNLAAVPYTVAYNLALGLIYSQSALLSGGLTFALTGLKKIALLAAFLVTTAGSLFYSQCAIRGALSTPATICSYMSSTRLYTPSTIINEIPSYSFTVGNLHAHLLALPFFLFGLCLLYWTASSRKPDLLQFALLTLTIATTGLINSWDAITLFVLAGTLLLLKLLECVRLSRRTALLWAVFGVATVGSVLLLMSSPLLHFESPVLGVGFSPGYAAFHGLRDVQYPTPVAALVGMWGAYLAGALLIWITRWRDLRNLQFIVGLLAASIAILLGIELFFVRDIYSITNPPYFRANTTFKFGYHIWVMLSVAFSACVGSVFSGRPPARWGAFKIGVCLLCVITILGGAVYPFEAVRQYYGSSAETRTLDSSSWMKATRGDWDSVQYINTNIPERSVIAEAVGESYTTHSRIATFTGMITPMGWQWHEWTWRFRSGDAARAPLNQMAAVSWAPISITSQYIASLYMTHDVEEAKRIIERYGIQYVYVGELERKTYPGLDEAKFHELGRVVFESHGSKLFAVN